MDEQLPPKPKKYEELELDDKLSCGLSKREIIQMKHAGMGKPDFVTWSDWNGPTQLSHRHMLIAHLLALGYSHKDIARATNIGQGRLSTISGSEIMKNAVKQIREIELQGMGVEQKLGQLTSQAMRIYEAALFNPEISIKYKLQAADSVLDRKLGRPQQRVEVGGSLLGEFFNLLKKVDSDGKLPVIESELSEDALLPSPEDMDFPEVVEVKAEALKVEPEPKGPDISGWIKENLK